MPWLYLLPLFLVGIVAVLGDWTGPDCGIQCLDGFENIEICDESPPDLVEDPGCTCQDRKWVPFLCCSWYACEFIDDFQAVLDAEYTWCEDNDDSSQVPHYELEEFQASFACASSNGPTSRTSTSTSLLSTIAPTQIMESESTPTATTTSSSIVPTGITVSSSRLGTSSSSSTTQMSAPKDQISSLTQEGTTSTPTSEPIIYDHHPRLSTGSKVGISIGAVVGVFLILLGLYFYKRQRTHRSALSTPNDPSQRPGIAASGEAYTLASDPFISTADCSSSQRQETQQHQHQYLHQQQSYNTNYTSYNAPKSSLNNTIYNSSLLSESTTAVETVSPLLSAVSASNSPSTRLSGVS